MSAATVSNILFTWSILQQLGAWIASAQQICALLDLLAFRAHFTVCAAMVQKVLLEFAIVYRPHFAGVHKSYHF